MKSMLYEVSRLRDRYFGQHIADLTGESIAKCLSHYTNEADNGGRVEFSYRHWSGYEEPVEIWISRIGVDKFDNCLIEMSSNKDILDHYWPSPTDMQFIPYIVDVCKTSRDFQEVFYRV